MPREVLLLQHFLYSWTRYLFLQSQHSFWSRQP